MSFIQFGTNYSLPENEIVHLRSLDDGNGVQKGHHVEEEDAAAGNVVVDGGVQHSAKLDLLHIIYKCEKYDSTSNHLIDGSCLTMQCELNCF